MQCDNEYVCVCAFANMCVDRLLASSTHIDTHAHITHRLPTAVLARYS
eukprot:SAG22_NODE_19730_length_272_cov_0.601156_1_plen_47_part_10